MPENPIPAESNPSAAPGQAVAALLGRLRTELRGAIARRAAWQAFAALAGCLWLGLVLDRWLEPPPAIRATVLGSAVVALLLWLGWIVAPRCLRRLSDRQVITLLHGSAPDEADLLATALDLGPQSDGHGHPALARATLDAADRAAESLGDLRLVRETSSYGSAWFATTALAGAIAIGAVRPDLAGAFVDRLTLSEALWPRRVELVPQGFEYDATAGEWVRVAARGEPAAVEVVATVAAGETPPATVWMRGGPDRRGGLSGLTRVGAPEAAGGVRQRYRRRVDRLDEDLTLSLRGGDARLRLRLIAADRPRLADVVIECRPPAYLDAPAFRASAGTLAALPEGSALVIRASVSKPLVGGVATVRNADSKAGLEVPLRVSDEGLAVAVDLPPLAGPCVVTLRVTDRDGLASEPLDTPIEIARDTAPTARLSLEGVASAITRDALLPVLVELDDDHTLRSVRLSIQRDADEPRRIRLPTPDTLPAESLGRVDLLSLRSAAPDRRLVVEPGDRLTLRALAADRYDLSERQPTESQPIELEVVTAAELLARLGDEQRELRRTLDGLLADAERLEYELDLEGRRLAESGGRSPEDRADLDRWSAERRLDTRKASNGVAAAADRAEEIRRQAVNNRLDQPALIDRLASDIVGPLRRVVRRDLASTRRRLEGLQPGDAAEPIAAAAVEVARAAATLERVAASLDSQQGYNEVVALLRGLVREQRRVNEKTSREKAQSVRGLFE